MMKYLSLLVLSFIVLSCNPETTLEDLILEEKSKVKVPDDVLELKKYTDNLLAGSSEALNSRKKKVNILWNTRKIVNSNVYAEFQINDKSRTLSSKGFSKNNRAYFFAEKLDKPKYNYLVFINPADGYKMDYKNFDIFNLKKIKYTGFVNYFDLGMNFEHSNYYENGLVVKISNKKTNKSKIVDENEKLRLRCDYTCGPCAWYECTYSWDPNLNEWNVITGTCDFIMYSNSMPGCGDSSGGGGEVDCTDPANFYDPYCFTGGGGGIDCNDPVYSGLSECQEEDVTTITNFSGDKFDYIIEKSSFTNCQALKCVYDKLSNMGNPMFCQNIESTFQNSTKHDLVLKVGGYNAVGAAGPASTSFWNGSEGVVMTFHNFNCNLDDGLAIAGTILHETVHAKWRHDIGASGMTDAQCKSAFAIWAHDKYQAPYDDHDVMVRYWIKKIGENLRTLDGNQYDYTYYMRIASDGLLQYAPANLYSANEISSWNTKHNIALPNRIFKCN